MVGVGIRGEVRSAFMCMPVSGAIVRAKDVHGKVIGECSTDKKGRWFLKWRGVLYSIRFVKSGYMEKEVLCSDNFPSVVRLLEDKIIGYQDRLWFTPGESISVYIHAPEGFSAVLVRHGYCVERVLDFGEHPAVVQEIPDAWFVAGGLRWAETIRYKIPKGAVPGVYSLNLRSKGDKKELYRLTFVLSTRPEKYGKEARLLVLASTNTWQAYNVWGGRSRYRNLEDQSSSLKERLFILSNP